MDTKFPVILTLSIGAAVLIFQLSGAGALFANTTSQSYASDDVLVDQNDRTNIENESAYGGQVGASAESDIVGVIIGSIPRMLSLLAIPGVLASELQTLTPAPWYIAQPVGFFFNIVVYIGGFQVATGREYI